MSGWEASLLVIGTIGSIAAALGAWWEGRRGSAAQLTALQRKLDLVMAHLGIPAPEESEVRGHLENGRTAEAVRAYREQTGAGLLEAKQAVDRIAGTLRTPERP
jgi:hypothetical protein